MIIAGSFAAAIVVCASLHFTGVSEKKLQEVEPILPMTYAEWAAKNRKVIW